MTPTVRPAVRKLTVRVRLLMEWNPHRSRPCWATDGKLAVTSGDARKFLNNIWLCPGALWAGLTTEHVATATTWVSPDRGHIDLSSQAAIQGAQTSLSPGR